MTLVSRYIRREILASFGFVLIGFLALFAFFDLVNELDEIGRGGYQLQHALAFIALGMPSRVYDLMPVAALIGAIYALAQFASHSEFTVMRAAGMGRRQAMGAVAGVGAWLALCTAIVGEVVTPPAEKLAQTVRLGAMGATVSTGFRSGLWVKDTTKDASGGIQRMRFVNVGELLPDTTLRSVRIFEFDRDFRLVELAKASSGRFVPPDSWDLEDVELTRFTPVRVADDTVALNANREVLQKRIWSTELTPDIVGVLMLAPERMSAWNLVQYVNHLRDNRQSTERYEIALWTKIVYPLAVIVMMMLALPFAYLQTRAGGIGFKVFAGIMLGVTFHFMNGLFSHLGLLHTWPAWMTASIPSAVALVCALGMLAWVDRAR
jgi:lipopolysaccharide export system permease protein